MTGLYPLKLYDICVTDVAVHCTFVSYCIFTTSTLYMFSSHNRAHFDFYRLCWRHTDACQHDSKRKNRLYSAMNNSRLFLSTASYWWSKKYTCLKKLHFTPTSVKKKTCCTFLRLIWSETDRFLIFFCNGSFKSLFRSFKAVVYLVARWKTFITCVNTKYRTS